MTHPTSTRRRGALAAGAILVLALGLTACGSDEGTNLTAAPAPTDGVLELGFLDDPGQPPDPDVFYAGSGLALTTNLYEGLVEYADGDKPTLEPKLATEWTADKTNTRFTFKLRKGVTFHDGTPFDASAVQASFERRLAVGGGPAYMAEGVKSFQSPDPYTVTITLEQPNSSFLDQLASPYGPRMMSPTGLKKHAAEDHAQAFLAAHSLGTGPYQLSVAKVDDRYQLKAFDDYWGEEPQFTTVDFRVYKDVGALQLALNNGDLAAIIGAVPSSAQTSYAKQDTLDVYKLPTFQVGILQMNPNREFMKTPEARKALYQAIDWDKVIEQIVPETNVRATGAYAEGALPEGVAPMEVPYDPEPLAAYAKSLPKNTPVDIGVVTGGGDDSQIANLVAAQLQALGLKAKVTEHQTSEIFGEFHEDPTKAPDVMFSSKTWPDSSDPYLYGHVFWDPDGGLNHLGCSDATATKELAEGLRTGSEEDYAAAAAAITKAMCNPIWSYARDFVVAQPWLGGVEEAHSVAEPYTLAFAELTVEE